MSEDQSTGELSAEELVGVINHLRDWLDRLPRYGGRVYPGQRVAMDIGILMDHLAWQERQRDALTAEVERRGDMVLRQEALWGCLDLGYRIDSTEVDIVANVEELARAYLVVTGGHGGGDDEERAIRIARSILDKGPAPVEER